jgi:hypothetical protein
LGLVAFGERWLRDDVTKDLAAILEAKRRNCRVEAGVRSL